ncbi:hypothetical protein [Devosia chinhatensis]|uniref:Uncharacterized protein n=1 Tax=Devosia chinhatensis TaxID=429727 RepID=A0A0F5FLD8_9HYPH|nr:hypothetical protein [Devosia chinhatensis]KKB09661.1 hypothetical protein VE26_07255 [Devosia chinhatensis]
MKIVLLAATLALCASPALADQWRYEGGKTPIAWFDNGDAQFQFACRGGALAMGFWVRKPDASLANANAISVAIAPDTASGSAIARSGNVSFAQDMPLVHLDGSSVVVRGPVARQWARIAQNAMDNMQVAFVRSTASGVEAIDANAFGAKGSKSTIARVLGECG